MSKKISSKDNYTISYMVGKYGFASCVNILCNMADDINPDVARELRSVRNRLKKIDRRLKQDDLRQSRGNTMTKQQFLKELAKFPGVTWDTDMEEAGVLQVDTPKGKLFADSGCHTMVEPFNNYGQSWKPEAFAEIIRRLQYGLIDCEETDCDACSEKEVVRHADRS